MEHKGYHIEEERGEYEIYESREAWINGRPPMHSSESEQEARDWIDREVGASSPQLPQLSFYKRTQLQNAYSHILAAVEDLQTAQTILHDTILPAESRIKNVEDLFPVVRDHIQHILEDIEDISEGKLFRHR